MTMYHDSNLGYGQLGRKGTRKGAVEMVYNDVIRDLPRPAEVEDGRESHGGHRKVED